VKGFGNDAEGDVYVAASKILGPAGTTGAIFKIVAPNGNGHGKGHGQENGNSNGQGHGH
jgi:hypothetical protein